MDSGVPNSMSTCSTITGAVQSVEDARGRRLEERDANRTTIETFGLIKRTRGGARRPNRTSEVFS